MRTLEKRIADAGDLSANFISGPQEVYYLTGLSIRFVWSGDPKGFIFLEASNEDATTPDASRVWYAIPESFIDVDGPGKFLLNVWLVNYRFIRVCYERTSGSGFIDAYIIGKGR